MDTLQGTDLVEIIGVIFMMRILLTKTYITSRQILILLYMTQRMIMILIMSLVDTNDFR